jgi:subtilisin family serine protease
VSAEEWVPPTLWLPWHIKQMRIPDIWSATGVAGRGVKVAVIDSGVHLATGLESPRIQQVNADGATTSGDPNDHGTMCASVIASQNPEAPGVAPEANILSIQAATPGGALIESQATKAIGIALKQKCDVISCSFVLREVSAEFRDLVEKARAEGVFVVGAAGRESDPTGGFPEETPYALAVSAVDWMGDPLAGARRGSFVDFATYADQLAAVTPAGWTTHEFGESSGAAAVMSGILALFLSIARAAGREADIKAVLLQEMARTARDVGQAGRDDATGVGLVEPWPLYQSLVPRLGTG